MNQAPNGIITVPREKGNMPLRLFGAAPID